MDAGAGDGGNVTSTTVGGVTLASNMQVVPIIIASWQPNNSNITWPSGFVAEAAATDGYSYVVLGEGLNSEITNSLPQIPLQFATAQAVVDSQQIAVVVQ